MAGAASSEYITDVKRQSGRTPARRAPWVCGRTWGMVARRLLPARSRGHHAVAWHKEQRMIATSPGERHRPLWRCPPTASVTLALAFLVVAACMGDHGATSHTARANPCTTFAEEQLRAVAACVWSRRHLGGTGA